MSISNLPLDGLPTPPAPMKGSRSKPGGLNIDCTSGSMPSAVRSLVPLLTTRTIDSEQLRLPTPCWDIPTHSPVNAELLASSTYVDGELWHANPTWA
ncbi:hypothetical protein HaLaN_21117 [Haematococcus lacustris]|uniref:Uncharacterized protein n=1 Tax=Haematococcus lacustris TaxID=44745 RepID=A0A699ZV55_HAELA|nr:hypothetical protein HaLaN_21117 [Haematococcus lacustris]